jgi:hypothetical protein
MSRDNFVFLGDIHGNLVKSGGFFAMICAYHVFVH